jgi:hypothetical protein
LTLAAVLALPVPAAWAAEAVTLRVLEDTQERIVVEYELGGFTDQSIEIDGSQYAQIALGTESLMKVKGAPELPNVCRSFIIPADAKMEALVLAGDYYEITDIDVVPSKGFIKRNVNPKDVPYTFGEVYAIDAHYPPKLVDVRKAYIMRDFRGLVVELNAFQYNPVARTLRVHTSVTVALVNTGPGQVNVLPQRERELSLSFDSIYEHHFVNYERSSRCGLHHRQQRSLHQELHPGPLRFRRLGLRPAGRGRSRGGYAVCLGRVVGPQLFPLGRRRQLPGHSGGALLGPDSRPGGYPGGADHRVRPHACHPAGLVQARHGHRLEPGPR